MMDDNERESPVPSKGIDGELAPVQNLFVISPYVEKYFGSNHFVFHEIKSSVVHLDVHIVAPTATRPFFTLITSGMSDLRMTMPEGLKELGRVELCICLPAEWPLSVHGADWKTPEFYWPIRILKQTARYPHVNNTWFSWGHTVPEAIAMDPAGRFFGILLAGPGMFPENAPELFTKEGEPITFLAVIPLLKEELEFAREHGSDAVEDKLIAGGVSELLDPQRKSICRTPFLSTTDFDPKVVRLYTEAR